MVDFQFFIEPALSEVLGKHDACHAPVIIRAHAMLVEVCQAVEAKRIDGDKIGIILGSAVIPEVVKNPVLRRCTSLRLRSVAKNRASECAQSLRSNSFS